jgi:enoyl-CoA hydratase
MPETEPPVLVERHGALGLVTLNRPKALNALTHDMCRLLHQALEGWAGDAAIEAVAIRGMGPRGFCAGGDIRALWESARQEGTAAADFLRDEYRLNDAIAAFPKPYIALLHGIVMGGGAGVSVHGRYRLADVSLDFAMPETGIGFVTDIGGSYFLSRLPGETGLYLALTGRRIGQGDALALGLATHAVALDDHAALIARLARGEPAVEAIESLARKPAKALLTEQRGAIDRLFSAGSVEAILERLERDGGDFAVATARTLRARSPSALKFTFRALRLGKTLSLRDCLRMEYRVALRAIAANDFREGVRALLIDKDGRPAWNPPALAGIADAAISACFQPLGARELSFA